MIRAHQPLVAEKKRGGSTVTTISGLQRVSAAAEQVETGLRPRSVGEAGSEGRNP